MDYFLADQPQNKLISLVFRLALKPTLVNSLLEQAAGHLRWKVDYPPLQPGFGVQTSLEAPQQAKLPSFGGYSIENLKLTLVNSLSVLAPILLLVPLCCSLLEQPYDKQQCLAKQDQ